MHASKGDWIEVDSMEVGGNTRKGLILEVLGPGDHEHYRVRWDDDHVSLFFPGSSTHVVVPKDALGRVTAS